MPPLCLAVPIPSLGCEPGYTSCAGACVYEPTDPNNCGACGNQCHAGICVAGQCTTTSNQLLPGTSALALAVDATSLYYVGTSNDIWQVDTTTLAKTQLAGGQAGPHALAIDDGYVYWTSNLGGAVLRTAKGGSPVIQVLYPAVTPTGIAVDATNVYWSDSTGTHSAAKGGGGTVTNLTTRVASSWQSDATTLYSYTEVAAYIIGAIDKTTGAYLEYANAMNIDFASSAAISATGIWWLGRSCLCPMCAENQGCTESLYSAARGSTAAVRYPFVLGTMPVVDGCTLYFFSGDGTGIMKVRLPQAGSDLPPPSFVGPGYSASAPLVVDAKYVYWIDPGLTLPFIGRLPK
jgi:hypothetical protein